MTGLSTSGGTVNIAGTYGTLTDISSLTIQNASPYSSNAVLEDAYSTGAGTLALIEDGSSTQTLSGASTYTGGTTVEAGTLALTGSGTLGSTTSNVNYLTVESGATLNLGGTSQSVAGLTSLTVPVAGGSSLQSVTSGGTIISNGGAGILTLVGYTGGSSSGTILANGTGSLELIYSGATGNNQTLTGANTYTGGTKLTGTGSLILSGSGTIGNTSSANNFLTINSGTLDLGGTSLSLAGLFNGTGGTLTSNGTSSSNTATTFTLTGGVASTTTTDTTVLADGNNGSSADVLSFVYNPGLSTATQQMKALSTYTGGTTVSSGILQQGVVESGTSGAFGSTNGALTIGAAGTVDLYAKALGVGALNGSAGAVIEDSSTAQTLTVGNGNATGSYAGIIQNSITLAKVGSGTLTLSGANTYTAGTTVSGGTVVMSGAGTLGSPTATTNFLTVSGGGVVDLNGTSQSVAGVNGSGGTIKSNGALGTLNLIGRSASTSDVFSDGTGQLALVDNSGGAYTQVLSGASTYTGGTTAEGGILQQGVANAFGSTTATMTINAGGTLDLGGYNLTVGALNGANSLTAFITNNGTTPAAATLTIGNGNASGSDGDIIENGTNAASVLSILKVGTGTETLSYHSTYTGGTTVEQGTLGIGGSSSGSTYGALGVGTVYLGDSTGDNASLLTEINATFNNAVVVAASPGNSNTLTLGGGTGVGTSNFTGGITLDNNLTVTQVAGGVTSINTTNVVSGASGTQTLTFGENNSGSTVATVVVSSQIGGGAGTINLVQSGTGLTELSSTTANTYTGTTLIQAGTLQSRATGIDNFGNNTITIGDPTVGAEPGEPAHPSHGRGGRRRWPVGTGWPSSTQGPRLLAHARGTPADSPAPLEFGVD